MQNELAKSLEASGNINVWKNIFISCTKILLNFIERFKPFGTFHGLFMYFIIHSIFGLIFQKGIYREILISTKL